jgi:hypothetical protein
MRLTCREKVKYKEYLPRMVKYKCTLAEESSRGLRAEAVAHAVITNVVVITNVITDVEITDVVITSRAEAVALDGAAHGHGGADETDDDEAAHDDVEVATGLRDGG